MMNEIDWSKAPEGATHCLKWAGEFYKPANKGYLWNGFQWIQTVNDFEWTISREGVESRPSSPAWNGEGLPPINARCEYIDSDGRWIKCEVVAHRNNAAVILDDHYECALVVSGELRPIRTPEQIAAEEREKAVQEMMKSCSLRARNGARQVLGELYDAGYRKTGEAK